MAQYKIGATSRKILLIEDISTLKDVVAAANGVNSVMALDTEFDSSGAYFPVLSLMQLSMGNGSYIIDMLRLHSSAGQDVEALLRQALSMEGVKVMHASEQDIKILWQYFAVTPKNLFDTQVAAKFLGFTESPSYAKLVKHYLNIVLDKHCQFGNWLNRPLSQQQLEYARNDVLYLWEIYHIMHQQLSSSGKLGWFAEEMQLVASKVDSGEGALVKLFYKMLPTILSEEAAKNCYHLLCAREELASFLNHNRQKIISNAKLLIYANHKDFNPSKISMHSRYKKAFLDILAKVSSDQATPQLLLQQAPPRKTAAINNPKVLAKLKMLLLETAKKHGIAVDLLASSAELMRFAQGKSNMLDRGWRYELFGSIAQSLKIG